jgi:hypothetical protein
MRDVFPHVMAIDVARYTNTILVGSHSPLAASAMAAAVERLPTDSPVHEVANWSRNAGNMRAIEPGGFVFSDDRAPVEMVIDQMILDAARAIGGP